MSTEELIAAAEGLVKELQGRINGGGMDLQEAEAKILEMVNWIGDVWLCSTEISSATSVLLTTARSKLPDRVNPCYRFWHWHPSGTSGTKRDVPDLAGHSGPLRESYCRSGLRTCSPLRCSSGSINRGLRGPRLGVALLPRPGRQGSRLRGHRAARASSAGRGNVVRHPG